MSEETVRLVVFFDLAFPKFAPFLRERWLKGEDFSMQIELNQSPQSSLLKCKIQTTKI